MIHNSVDTLFLQSFDTSRFFRPFRRADLARGPSLYQIAVIVLYQCRFEISHPWEGEVPTELLSNDRQEPRPPGAKAERVSPNRY